MAPSPCGVGYATAMVDRGAHLVRGESWQVHPRQPLVACRSGRNGQGDRSVVRCGRRLVHHRERLQPRLRPRTRTHLRFAAGAARRSVCDRRRRVGWWSARGADVASGRRAPCLQGDEAGYSTSRDSLEHRLVVACGNSVRMVRLRRGLPPVRHRDPRAQRCARRSRTLHCRIHGGVYCWIHHPDRPCGHRSTRGGDLGRTATPRAHHVRRRSNRRDHEPVVAYHTGSNTRSHRSRGGPLTTSNPFRMTAAAGAKRVLTSDPVIGSYEPRFAGLWATVTYAIATLALGLPALAGQFLVGPHSDQYIAGYAFREFAASTLKATGSFPLWNPYQFGGMPFVAAMHGDIFYPTFLLRMVLPTDVAMTWGFMIHIFLAGAFTYMFMRRANFGFVGAFVGGLAYMLSGHIATYVNPGHDGKLFVAALFPLLLWTIIAWVRDGRLWALGAIAATVGLDILAPHPQLLEYSLLAAGAYAVVLAVGLVRDGTGDGKLAVKRLAAALIAVGVGLAIGAVQYLPVREYVAWSPRAAGIGTYERATSYAKNPQEILNAYLPEFTGILDHYWAPNGIHFQGDYVGVVVLMLGGLGLSGIRRDKRSR